jgi:hypothetical protein
MQRFWTARRRGQHERDAVAPPRRARLAPRQQRWPAPTRWGTTAGRSPHAASSALQAGPHHRWSRPADTAARKLAQPTPSRKAQCWEAGGVQRRRTSAPYTNSSHPNNSQHSAFRDGFGVKYPTHSAAVSSLIRLHYKESRVPRVRASKKARSVGEFHGIAPSLPMPAPKTTLRVLIGR